ncbi:hypothetical protein SCHPADRAFT_692586 [Schizopora paradoxa]|uniref:GEgh 16 protein n=1 Tax=Schizopora paradoxa TaxID=27342 RepID=A0A0H2R4U3_9AGAM|nr:hypothetical protein SCHPADRAFT_692586 [Schizopora paradoxa]
MIFPPYLLLSALVVGGNAHSVITQVLGANGVDGQGFGVIPGTPRDGSTPGVYEQDSSIIRNNEINTGKAGPCGRTPAGGNNDVASQMDAAVEAGLPSASADGVVSMILHQVNQDGAGPYSCDISTDGSGSEFVSMEVTQNVPGFASLSLAAAQDFPLDAQLPAGTNCTGGPDGNACLIRCRNSAIAGPFGGCVAVKLGNS